MYTCLLVLYIIVITSKYIYKTPFPQQALKHTNLSFTSHSDTLRVLKSKSADTTVQLTISNRVKEKITFRLLISIPPIFIWGHLHWFLRVSLVLGFYPFPETLPKTGFQLSHPVFSPLILPQLMPLVSIHNDIQSPPLSTSNISSVSPSQHDSCIPFWCFFDT